MKMLKMATVCSGVGAPEVAYNGLFNPVWSCEFDAFPSAVLKYHFPDVPNLGDMTKLKDNDIFNNTEIDILVGGTPCQGFSVAGQRGGLENDNRSRLTLEFIEILRVKRPRWFIWENVPGVFSSGGGRDFKNIIQAFNDIGYGLCWRVLDAQHFGVPQRRRIVFVVGYLGDWRPSYRVLLESSGLSGNFKESREKKKGSTRNIKNSTGETSYFDKQAIGQYGEGGLSSTLAARDFRDPADIIVHGTQDPCVSKKAFCLGRNNGQENALMVHENQRAEISLNDSAGSLKGSGGKLGQGYSYLFRYSKSHRTNHIDQRIYNDGTTNTLNTGDGCSNQSTQNIVIRTAQTGSSECGINENGKTYTLDRAQGQAFLSDTIIRKLTPLECERLQGFPDNWTKIPYRNKDDSQCPKGPRYKAMGNSMAVPVMRWIGERLAIVNAYMELQEND